MITRGDPKCSYVINLLKRLLFNSLPSYHRDVHSPNFQLGWVGSSYQGTTLEVLFMGVFLGSSLLFASCGVDGPILVDGTF